MPKEDVLNPTQQEVPMRAVSRAAGAAYLTIIVAGIFAEFFVRGDLIVAGDATATAARIAESQQWFRVGLLADLVMLLCDVGVAAALYVLLAPTSAGLALLAAFLRMAHACVNGAGLLNLLQGLALLSGAEHLGAFSDGQLHSLLALSLKGHSNAYVLALVFFGLHCAVLGWLLLRSEHFPRALGVLLMAASAGYLFDSGAQVLLVNYAAYQELFLIIVFLPAFTAELSLGVFLLGWGFRVARP
jgi:hypothetical protein